MKLKKFLIAVLAFISYRLEFKQNFVFVRKPKEGCEFHKFAFHPRKRLIIGMAILFAPIFILVAGIVAYIKWLKETKFKPESYQSFYLETEIGIAPSKWQAYLKY